MNICIHFSRHSHSVDSHIPTASNGLCHGMECSAKHVTWRRVWRFTAQQPTRTWRKFNFRAWPREMQKYEEREYEDVRNDVIVVFGNLNDLWITSCNRSGGVFKRPRVVMRNRNMAELTAGGGDLGVVQTLVADSRWPAETPASSLCSVQHFNFGQLV
jgi:hypothetical protein